MEWKLFFRPHILDRGYDYYLDDKVNITNESDAEIAAEVDGTQTYNVSIGFQNGAIDHMTCDCPYATDGNYCKHMAATLYQHFYGDELKDSDYNKSPRFDGLLQHINEEEREVENLLGKIPKAEKHRLLVELLTGNTKLKNSLKMKYDFRMDAEQMRLLKNEIRNIVNEHTVRGFVDWQDAYGLCCELCRFSDERVDALIEKNCLLQAFELNNQLLEVVGTIDMDDSDGGSAMVAENCYEKWLKIYQLANDTEKKKIKEWFSAYEKGRLYDYIEEYLFDFQDNELASAEIIAGMSGS